VFASVSAKTNCTVSDLHDLLRAFEHRQNMLSSSNPKGFEPSANSASRGGGGGRGYYKKNNHGRPRGREEDKERNGGGGRRPPQGGRGHGCGRGRGGDPPRHRDNIMCQICKKEGHSAYTCWWRYADNDNDDEYYNDEKEVNAAYGVDTNWYTDTGATDHIIGNLEKLMIRDRYHGKVKIHTANGEGMNISHIGHSLIQTPNHELHLQKFFMFLVRQKIFFLFINLLLTTMPSLNFILGIF
jgi:hypothetical protein